MRTITRVLELDLAYRLWQAPFAERKLAPLFEHNDLGSIRRVLDVGCGPGTNTHHFRRAEHYLGIDFNEAYIRSARRRHGREFRVADVTEYHARADEKFDFILANSLFHHIERGDAERVLHHLSTLLTPDGHIHVLDLVLPEAPSAARLLARWDRGDYPRPLQEWRELFCQSFEPVVFQPYPLGSFGMELWSMVYFKGRTKQS